MSMLAVRDLVFHGHADKEALRQGLDGVVRDWLSHWGTTDPARPGPGNVADVRDAQVTDVHAPWRVPHGGTQGLWVMYGQGSDASLRPLLMGMPHHASPRGSPDADDWASDVLATARQDLEARLSAQVGRSQTIQGDASLEEAGQAYAGCVLVEMVSLGLSLLIDGRLLPRGYRQQAGSSTDDIVMLSTALGGFGVNLALNLGETHITVEDLLVLREGDVIRFPALLKEPLPLAAADQASVLLVQPGAQDGRWAMKITGAPKAQSEQKATALGASGPPSTQPSKSSSKAFALNNPIKLN